MKYFYLIFTGLLLPVFGNLRAQCSANIQYTYNGLADFTFTVTDKQDTTGLATYQWTLYPDSLVLDSNAQQVQHHFDTNGTYTICLHVADSVCTFDTCLNITVTNADYHPLLDTVNRWNMIVNICFVMQEPSIGTRDNCGYVYYGYQQYYTGSDTIIDSVLYKQVFTNGSSMLGNGWASPCAFGYVREEVAARKVYFRDNLGNPEQLLYDFNIAVGDTCLFLQYNGSQNYDSVKWVVEQKFKHSFKVGVRNVWQLKNLKNHTYYLWVEGIGCINSPFFTTAPSDNWGCSPTGCYAPNDPFVSLINYNGASFLSCFYHAQNVYFDSCAYYNAVANYGNGSWCFAMPDSCSYGWICGNVKNIPSLTSFTITPNPASGQAEVILDVNEGSSFSLSILNTAGSVLVSNFYSGHLNEGLHKKTMRLQNLPVGIYLVECRSGKSATYRKLVVGH